MIVEEETDADHPGRPQRILVRQHEGQRADDVGGVAQQHLALDERLAHQAELVIFEVAQAAMDELGAGRGGGAGEVGLLDQQHLEAAAGGVAGDAGTVDAAADDQEIDDVVARLADRQTLTLPVALEALPTAQMAALPRTSDARVFAFRKSRTER